MICNSNTHTTLTMGIWNTNNGNKHNVNIEQSHFNIYPNPSNSLVHLSWENDYNKLLIFNSLGKKVISMKVMNQSKLNLSIDDWPKGIYYITLKSEKEEQTQKLIVQ